jgi:exopolysaccharide biosynthesis polyprenyl glycosylphosphotransferase
MLALADMCALAAALSVGVVLVDGVALTPYVFLAFPALIVAAKVLGLYDRDQHLVHKTTLDELPILLQVSILVAFGASLLQGPLVDGTLSAVGLLVFAAALFVGLATTRAIARRVAQRLAPTERCVVIGGGDDGLADELAQKVEASGGTTVEFVGAFDEQTIGHANGNGHVNGNGNGANADRLAGIAEFLVKHDIHRVVLAPGAEHRGDMLALVGEIKSLGVKISVLPSVTQAGGTSFELDRIDGITLLGMRGFEFNRSSLIIKRGMDLAISGAALLFLSPVLALIALAIKLDSRGPVLYRQTRVGRRGEHFEMLKFRTMGRDAHKRRDELDHLNEAVGGLFKIADDPRVTRIGKHLRALSIDELPQLFNVLRGEMSLVGPRPLVVEEDRLIQGWHRQRLSLTPGMTGYWQVLGSARLPLDEMVKLDYSYVQNWSAWHDVQLLLRTIPFVAARRGL